MPHILPGVASSLKISWASDAKRGVEQTLCQLKTGQLVLGSLGHDVDLADFIVSDEAGTAAPARAAEPDISSLVTQLFLARSA